MSTPSPPPDPTTLPPPEGPADGPTLPPLIDDGLTLAHGSPAVPADVQSVPGYELLAEIGRGGMGVVYKARQTALNRVVALKMILAGPHAEPKQLIRFLAEAEAVAAVRHPGVVQVYDFGQHAGRPYMALEYLGGGSLAELLAAGGRLDPRAAAELVGKLAAAVQAAHDQGIVHRDLKPANVLMGEGGTPKVTDFGLAKRAAGSDLTKTNAVMGTPAYMAPEQARGEAKFVGPGADVYALGVILYECLTGTLPFRADDAVALLMMVAQDDPPPPRTHVKDLPRDLDLICLKCLAKPPHERYPTAAALADDLGRFLRGEPVSVRPATRTERLVKWARRNPKDAAIVGAVLATLVAATAASLWASAKFQAERDYAVRQEEEREKEAIRARAAEESATKLAGDLRATADQLRAEKDAAEVLLARNTLAAAQADWDRNQVVTARARLAEVPDRHRGWEWRLLRRAYHHPGAFTLHPVSARTGSGEDPIPTPPRFTPDGAYLVGHGHGLQVWDARTGAAVRTLDDSWTFAGPVPGPDGKVYAHDRQVVRVWDVRTGKRERDIPAGPGVTVIALSPDGRSLAIAVHPNGWPRGRARIEVWDPAAARRVLTLTGHQGAIENLVFAPDGNRLLGSEQDWSGTGGGRSQPVLRAVGWDTRSGAFDPPRTTTAEALLEVLAVAPDGRTLAVRYGGAVGLTDAAIGTPRSGWAEAFGAPDSAVAFSPDGTLIAVGDEDLAVFEARTGRLVTEYRGLGRVGAVTFSPDGRTLLAVNATKTAVAFRLPAGVAARGRSGAGNLPTSLAFAPDGRRLAGLDVSRFLLADLTATAAVTHTTHAEAYQHLGYGPAGPRVARQDPDTGVSSVIDPATGRTVTPLPEGESLPTYVSALTRDASRVFTGRQVDAAGQPGWRLTARAAETGAKLWDMPLPNWHAYLGSSPDGGRLLVRVPRAGGGDELAVLDGGAGTRVGTLPDAPGDRAFVLPGGRRAVLASWADAVLLDLDGGPRRDLRGHAASIQAIDCLPDGSRVLTADAAGVLMVWNPETGQPVVSVKVADRPVRAIAVSPDGHQLAVHTEDDRLSVWDLRPTETEAVVPGRWDAASRWTFSLDGRRIVTLDADRKLRVREADGLTLVREWPVPPPAADTQWAVFTMIDGKTVYTYQVGKDGLMSTAASWNADTGATSPLGQPTGSDYATAFAPNGHRELVLRDGTLRMIDRTPSAAELAARAVSARADRDYHMNLAGEHYNARRWFAAAAQYDLADRVSPLTPEERFWRGYARLELGQSDAARADLRAFYDTQKLADLETPDDCLDRALVELYSGRPGEARKIEAEMLRRYVFPGPTLAGLQLTASPLAPLTAAAPVAVAADAANWSALVLFARVFTRPDVYPPNSPNRIAGLGLFAEGTAQRPDRIAEASRDGVYLYWRVLLELHTGLSEKARETFEAAEQWRRKRIDPFHPGGPAELSAGRRAAVELIRAEVVAAFAALRETAPPPRPAR